MQLLEALTLGNSRNRYKLNSLPVRVAEIADVVVLDLGGGESDLRAARVRARALKRLSLRGLTVRGVLAPAREVAPRGAAAS